MSPDLLIMYDQYLNEDEIPNNGTTTTNVNEVVNYMFAGLSTLSFIFMTTLLFFMHGKKQTLHIHNLYIVNFKIIFDKDI